MKYTLQQRRLIHARAKAKLKKMQRQSQSSSNRVVRSTDLVYKTNRNALVRK